jgi:type IV pilus assembly protein PilY1
MKSRIRRVVLGAALMLSHGWLHAEDIDLFVGSPADANDLPNVLFIIDNTANWTSAFTNETAALASVFEQLEDENGGAKFNVGVIFSAETSSSDSNVSGGYVRAALRPMTPANKLKYGAMIRALDVGKDKGNAGVAALTMAEAYRYFSGGTPYAGNNKAKADYVGNTGADWSNSATTAASLTAMQAIYAIPGIGTNPGNALFSKGGTVYNWPVGSQCGKNYIIYISNGPAQDSNTNTVQANAMLAAANGDTTQIALSPTGSQSNASDEWARFLKQKSGLNVTTYTINVNPSNTGQGPGWTAVLEKMAEVSNGTATTVSDANGGEQIIIAVKKALAEIQGVNSVFASVSLPISANTQSTYSNQVYIGLFRPDAHAYPRWAGNLKQYQLGRLEGALRLVDADENGAVHSLTGFIKECARSFWTPTTADEYWTFRPAGEYGACTTLASGINYAASNFPDGNIVEKGGQGYTLRSTTARTLKTCSPTSCTTLTDFAVTNTTDITQARLGAADTAERTALIGWARGLDMDTEKDGPTAMRPSVHGDVVHSRPVAVDFGTATAPKVVVFYGGNDGVFRAVNGNQTASIGSAAAGSELWAFMPPEFYGNIKRIRDNTTQINFPNITTPGSQPKPYGMDGPITAYRGSTNTWVYATMRRGGRALYAFNVPNANPANITLKWKRGCDDSGCSTGFSGIGQTWSAPKPLTAAGYSSPLLIVGGGYDACEDGDPHTCTSATKGNKIYVLNADTGTLLNTFDTDRSVIADITVVPDSATGLAKYAYAADLGGNVYRVDIGTAAPLAWTSTKIASLGCSTPGTCASNRKFMFAPDVIEANGEYVVLLGSGDREKPLLYYSAATGVSNYFFMLRDRPAQADWLTLEATNCSNTAVICLNSLYGITGIANPSAADLSLKKGWYLGMSATEQVVTSAITIFGTVTFSTHAPDVPQAGACTSRLGTARVYNIFYADAASANGTPDRSETLPADTGLPPSPVAGMVSMEGEEEPVAFCIGCGSISSIEAEEPPVPSSVLPTQPKGRVYWYIQR